MPGITPDNIGGIKAGDLLGAAILFDAKYRARED